MTPEEEAEARSRHMEGVLLGHRPQPQGVWIWRYENKALRAEYVAF